ncbi:MAG TPA: hypothetical protein VMR79_06325, partial [Verrucomicrobiae bacterium]|nr:hypothetical protein [Verrucomicrobiae bacterium]
MSDAHEESRGPGLTAALKERLIQESLRRRLRRLEEERERPGERAAAEPLASGSDPVPEAWCRFDQHPGYQQ